MGDVLLALPLMQSLVATGRGPVELVTAGDMGTTLAGRCAAATGRSLDSLPLAPLFAPVATAPESLLDWLSRFDEIVSAYPSEMFTANVRRAAPARVTQLDARAAAIEASGLHASEFLHRQLFTGPAPFPRVAASEADLAVGQALLGGACVLIHPGSGGRSKCWPIARFVEVAEALDRRYVAFVLGPAECERMSPADRAMLQRFRVLGDLSLPQLLCTLATADVYIGNDSGPTHMAAALGRPTVALFGPTRPAIWGPRGLGVAVLAGRSATQDWGIGSADVAGAVLRAIE